MVVSVVGAAGKRSRESGGGHSAAAFRGPKRRSPFDARRQRKKKRRRRCTHARLPWATWRRQPTPPLAHRGTGSGLHRRKHGQHPAQPSPSPPLLPMRPLNMAANDFLSPPPPPMRAPAPLLTPPPPPPPQTAARLWLWWSVVVVLRLPATVTLFHTLFLSLSRTHRRANHRCVVCKLAATDDNQAMALPSGRLAQVVHVVRCSSRIVVRVFVEAAAISCDRASDLVVCTSRLFSFPTLPSFSPQPRKQPSLACASREAGRHSVPSFFFPLSPCFVRGFGTPDDVSVGRCSAGRSIEG